MGWGFKKDKPDPSKAKFKRRSYLKELKKSEEGTEGNTHSEGNPPSIKEQRPHSKKKPRSKQKRRCCSRDKKRTTPPSNEEPDNQQEEKNDEERQYNCAHCQKEREEQGYICPGDMCNKVVKREPSIEKIQSCEHQCSHKQTTKEEHQHPCSHIQTTKEERQHECSHMEERQHQCSHCQNRREEKGYKCEDNICKKIVDTCTQFDEKYIPDQFCRGQCVTCVDKSICHKKQCVIDTIEDIITTLDKTTQFNSQADPPDTHTTNEDLLRPKSNEMCILECDINQKECCNKYSKSVQVTTMRLSNDKCNVDKCKGNNYGEPFSIQCDTDSIIYETEKQMNPKKITCRRLCVFEDQMVEKIESKIEEKVLSSIQAKPDPPPPKQENKDTQVRNIRECFCDQRPKSEEKKQVTIKRSRDRKRVTPKTSKRKITPKNSETQTTKDSVLVVRTKSSNLHNEVQMALIDFSTSNNVRSKFQTKDSETQMAQKHSPIKQTTSSDVTNKPRTKDSETQMSQKHSPIKQTTSSDVTNKPRTKDSETQMSQNPTPIKQTRSTTTQTSKESITSYKTANENDDKKITSTSSTNTMTQTSKDNLNTSKTTTNGEEHTSTNPTEKQLLSSSTQTMENVILVQNLVHSENPASDVMVPLRNHKIQTSKHLLNETINSGSIRIQPDQNPVTIVLEYNSTPGVSHTRCCGPHIRCNYNSPPDVNQPDGQQQKIYGNECGQVCCKCLPPHRRSLQQFDVKTTANQEPENNVATRKSSLPSLYIEPEPLQPENTPEPILEQPPDLPNINSKRNGLDTPEGDRKTRKLNHDSTIFRKASPIFRFVNQVPSTNTSRSRMSESNSLLLKTTKEFIKIPASNPNSITYNR